MNETQISDNQQLDAIDLGSKNYKDLYERGLELIKNEPEPKKLMLDILDEYMERLSQIPPVDLNSSDFDSLDNETKEKVKSLVLFGTQAVLVRENAKAQHNLRKANENYRDLLSVVTHEFKNSLTSIHGYNKILQKRLEEQKFENVTEISTHIDRLAKNLYGLVDTLFSMSLIEQGKLQVEKRIFDLITDAINPVVTELETRLQKKDMQIKVNSDQVENLYHGDERFFQLIFRNLFQNALQYGNEKSTINVDITKSEENVKIVVSNEGSGLDPKKIHKIFEKFSRFHDQNDKTNVGIGLFTVKNIIELHGGTIQAESETAKWMRFTIVLPA